mgnify:CR=1 FL=1
MGEIRAEKIVPRGKATRINQTASANIISPSSGKRLRLLGFFLWTNASITASIRWASTGDDIAGLSQQGVAAMNLIGLEEKGGADEPLYLSISGTGTVKGTVWTEEIS